MKDESKINDPKIKIENSWTSMSNELALNAYLNIRYEKVQNDIRAT